MKAVKSPTTLVEAIKFFSDEERAFNYAVKMRWPNGPVCPICGSLEHSFISTRKVWQCKGCSKQFTVKKGSIFEDSPIKIGTWMVAMWLLANAKNGISSYELHRSIGVTQKTAWFMLHRIRLAMQEGSIELSGTVEVDETYIGGKARNMHLAKRKKLGLDGYVGGTVGKTIVMGMLERGGKVKTRVIGRITRSTMRNEINKTVHGHSKLFSDGNRAYDDMSFYFEHKVVDHAVEYVRGNVHTNGIENYWSLLKRTIRGTYVSVEPFHLFRYLDEQAFRFNSRRGSDWDRFNIVAGMTTGKRLTYAKLIGKELAAGA